MAPEPVIANPPHPSARELSRELRALANPGQARVLQSFFKTGPGQYGEGDVFIGLKVPVIRRLTRRYRAMDPKEARELVRSDVHEERLAGLLLWVGSFQEGGREERRRIFDLYLRNTRRINNWDLVDLSAPQIVGGFVDPGDAALLDKLAGSDSLWERRIAIVATLAFIRRGVFAPTLRLCRLLMNDPHDLIHKACGWMLREVGKRDRATLSQFLDQTAGRLPRTALRYALEHYPEAQRKRYMSQRGA